MGYVPGSITVDRQTQTLSLIWKDGHETVFPLDGLRRACPCAGCQGHGKMHELPDPEIFEVPALMQWNNVQLRTAGSVGLRLVWDDGHDTGIHTWKRLRAMCPCPACR